MELPPLWRWCMYFVLTFPGVLQCEAQIRAISCPRGTFGSPNCQGICHCLSGNDYCQWEDGRCTDGKCSFGWINPPICQTACPYGMFGYNCSLLCHCPANDVCNHISGLCSSNQCQLGWGGSSCQKLLPVLFNPPDVTATTESQVTLSWPKWITGQTGLGVGNVISHTLQQIDNVTNSWQDVVNLQDSSALMRFTYTVVNLRPNTAYKYRIRLVMDDSRKPLPSVPGPESSRWIVTNCSAPSDPPTNVTAENHQTYIRVTWTPPSLESMNCNGLARHEIFIACISPCVNLMASEEWPANVSIIQYFHYTNYTINITVRAINDAGHAGPLSVPFYIVLYGEASSGVIDNQADVAMVLKNVDQSITTNMTPSGTPDMTTDMTSDVTTDTTSDVTADTTSYVTTDTTSYVTTDTTSDVTTDTTSDVTTDTTSDVITSTTADVTDRLISHSIATDVTTGLTASRRLEDTTAVATSVTATASQETITPGNVPEKVSTTLTLDSVGTSVTQSGTVSAETETTWQTQETSETAVGTGTPINSTPDANSSNQSVLLLRYRDQAYFSLELSPASKYTGEPGEICEIYIDDLNSGDTFSPPYEKPCISSPIFSIPYLSPATQYRITISMQALNDVLRNYTIVMFTAPPAPPDPPTPVISEVTNTSFKVNSTTSKPIELNSNISSQSLVVVEKLTASESSFQDAIDNRKTFPIEDSRAVIKEQHILLSIASAELLNFSYYVAGLIDSNGSSFVVGDGETYEGFGYPALVSCNYSNVPLVPNSWYMVWFVWENYFDGVTHRLASEPGATVWTGPDPPPTPAPTPTPSPTPSPTPAPAPTLLLTTVGASSKQSVLSICSRSEHDVTLELPNIDNINGGCCEVNVDDIDNGRTVLPPSVTKTCNTSCFFDIGDLLPATQYQVTVQLRNSDGVLRPYTIVLYTAPPPPPSPPTPSISEISYTTFKVKFSTRKRSAADILFRRLVMIEKLKSTKSHFQDAVNSKPTFLFEDRRLTSKQPQIMVNAASAKLLNIPFYVAGLIDSNGGPFVVGDGQTFECFSIDPLAPCAYINVPLVPKSSYMVWFVWENSLDGVTRRLASQPAGPVLTLFAPAPTPTSALASDGELSTAMIILIVLCVLLFCIILLILLIVLFWRRAKINRLTKVEIFHAPYQYPESSSVNRSLAVNYLNSILISKSEQKHPEAISGSVGDYVIPDACLVCECGGSSTSRSCPVPVQKLRDYCSEYLLMDSGCFMEEQFLLLPNCFTDSVNVGRLTCNAIHNRSAQVVPYDRNRVKLKHGLPQSTTYLNASFVRTIGRRYCIVTQCPTLSTLGHFWRMVWERATSTIVMLMDSEAPDSQNFDCYWPEKPGRYHGYDGINVELVSVDTFANYSVRHFKIGGENAIRERHIFHWQYMSWSKGGVPEHPIPFLSFVKRIREERKSDAGFLVHCRTGGGRSGVYIAVDTLLSQGLNTGVVDVLRLVTLLHAERSNLVKSFVQYRFIYECLCEEFDHNPSRYLAERFVLTFEGLETSETGLKTLSYEQQVMVQLPVYSDSMTRSLVSRKTMLPKASMSYPNAEEDDDSNDLDPYPFQILSGFNKRDMFIASRCPSDTYCDEFWHSITDNRVNCIVMLNKMADLPVAEHLLPQMGRSVNSKHFSVLCASVKSSPSNVYVAYNLKVRRRHVKDDVHVGAHNVRLFEFTKWPCDDEVPAVDAMHELLEQLRQWLNRYSSNRPVLLFSACGSGKSRAALLMVLWYVLEQSEKEGILDIFSTSRLIRSYIVSSMDHRDHYHFLYLAVRDFVKRNLAYYTLLVENKDKPSPTHRPRWTSPSKRHSTSASRTMSRREQSSTSELPPETGEESPTARLEGQHRKDPLRRNLYHTDLEEAEKESMAVTDKENNHSRTYEERYAEALSRPRVHGSIVAKKTDAEEDQSAEASTIPRVKVSGPAEYATVNRAGKSSNQRLQQHSNDSIQRFENDMARAASSQNNSPVTRQK